MSIHTINPTNANPIATYSTHSDEEVDRRLTASTRAGALWGRTPAIERASYLREVAANFRRDIDQLSSFVTLEMGKPILEAKAEVEKCAVTLDYYATHGPSFLEAEPQATSGNQSWIQYAPLGPVLAVMPWNYPLWQVVRAAAPILMGGNTLLLKHAGNVTGCALLIERAFEGASTAIEGLVQTLVVPTSSVADIIADRRVRAVTLTGSEAAGSQVGRQAGMHLKKCVLELGGSDAFIVLEDADVDAAARTAVRARFQNNGQSCIAAKRFIVQDRVHDDFVEAFLSYMGELRVGDPLDEATHLGPMARKDLRDDLVALVHESVRDGARLLAGGQALESNGFFLEPTLLVDVLPGNVAARVETFGPVAAVLRVPSRDAAIDVANASDYGLGGAIWTADIAAAGNIAHRLESGALFVNGMTFSDPRLPFGGVKRSGYGRELGRWGMQEFLNVQSVWVGPESANDLEKEKASNDA